MANEGRTVATGLGRRVRDAAGPETSALGPPCMSTAVRPDSVVLHSKRPHLLLSERQGPECSQHSVHAVADHCKPMVFALNAFHAAAQLVHFRESWLRLRFALGKCGHAPFTHGIRRLQCVA